MALGEAFTIMAVLEATDRMSSVIEKIDGSLEQFSETAKVASESAEAAGASIDESLLQTASGADAVDLATAQLESARARLTLATNAQADAERVLLAAQQAGTAQGEADAVAIDAQVAAADALSAAQENVAKAAAAAADAQARAAAVAQAQSAADDEAAASGDAAAASQDKVAASSDDAAASSGTASKAFGIAGLAVAAIGYESVKAAGNFQSLSEHLVTDAGESQSQLAGVQAGILKISTATGTSTTDLVNGMYHIESAGYHGAAGLQVLTTASEGAKVGGADLDTVSKALVGSMNAYGVSSSGATGMMNQLIATVGAGDMKMQDLASAMSSVTAVAAAAHIPFDQVGGAIATMTAQGMSANQATQDLGHTIGSLSNPNNVQIQEMQAMGLSSNQVATDLGKQGLTGTFAELTNAVLAHTRGSQVLISTFKTSTQAAADANTMIKSMPPNLQKLAQSYMGGSITAAQWSKDLKGLSTTQEPMMAQFGTLANKSNSFNAQLAAGGPAAQTYNAAMSKMMGGTVGLNTALMLTGTHTTTFNQNVATISAAAASGGNSVANWGAIQETFNQKMDRLKASVGAAGIAIGQVLLPIVSKVADVVVSVVGPMASWISQNQKLVGIAITAAGVIGAVVLAVKAWTLATKLWAAAQAFAADAMAAFNAVMDADPIVLLAVAVAALAVGVIYAYTHFKTFRDIVQDVFRAVETAAVDTWHVLEAVWDSVVDAAQAVGDALVSAWDAVVGAARAVGTALSDAWRGIEQVATTIWNAISGFFERWWKVLLFIFAPGIYLILAIWKAFHQQIEAFCVAVWNAVAGFLEGVWDGIKVVADAAWSLIKMLIVTPIEETWTEIERVWTTVSGWLSAAWAAISGVAATAWNAIYRAVIAPVERIFTDVSSWLGKIVGAVTTAFNGALSFVQSIGGKIGAVFADAGTWLLAAGKAILEGLLSGLKGAWNDVTSFVGGIGNWISSHKGPISVDAVLLVPHGKAIMGGLLSGLSSQMPALESTLGAVTKSISGTFGQQYSTGITASVAAQIAGSAQGASALGAAGGGGAGFPPVGAGLAALTGSGSSATPEIHIHLDGDYTLMTDQDIDKFAQKVGQRLATSIGPSGGVRF